MRETGRWLAPTMTAALSLLALTTPMRAQTCAAAQPGVQLGETIGLVADGSLPPGTIEQALTRWSSCGAMGSAFPVFSTTSPGQSTVTVRYIAASSQDGRCGFFAGHQVVLFAAAVDRRGRTVRCAPPAVNLAHELGHVLGLVDAPNAPRCRGFIMAGDDPRPGAQRDVRPEECQAANDHWRTPAEGAVLSSTWQRLEGADRRERWVPTAEAPFEDVGQLLMPPASAIPGSPLGAAPWDEPRRYPR
ncbi:MAG: hypothetical protein ABI609_10915 [Acidobacteriota bacterium]